MNRLEEAMVNTIDAYRDAREGMMRTWGMERLIKALDALAMEHKIAIDDARQHAQQRRAEAREQSRLDLHDEEPGAVRKP